MSKLHISPILLSLGFSLIALASPTSAATSLSCGSLVSGTISSAGQVDQYTYVGNAQGIITLTLAGFNTGYPNYIVPTATVYDPNGNKVTSFNANGQQQVTLGIAGAYQIWVEASDLSSTGNYSLGLVCRNPLQPAKSLSCGANTSGNLAASAQVDQYTFTGQPGGVVTLTLAGFNTGYPNYIVPTATLYDPNGSKVLGFNANSQQQVTLKLSGTYLLQIDATDLATTGTYNLGLVCRDPMEPAKSLSCGAIADGNLAASAQVDQYTFSGQAGGIVTLTLAGFNTGYPNYIVPTATLYDPSGSKVLGFNANSQQQVTLKLSGTYLIQVDAADLATTGTYNLGLVCRNPLGPASPLSCGSLASGKNISSPAQVDQYAYAGQAGGSLALTLAGFNTGYPNYVVPTATLYDPAGKQVVSISGNNQQQVTLSWTGTYLVQVYASDLATTGTYSLGVECITGLNGEGFVPVTPCRIADTRGNGFSGAFGPPEMAAGSTRSFRIPGSCGIPSDAQAYSLNITAVPPAPLGYLTIWPTGELQPLASNLNSSDSQVVAAAAIVPAGSDGAVSVYASNETNVVIDIDGYFAPQASSNDAFYTLTPCRIADTRPKDLTAESTTSFPILSSPCIPEVDDPYIRAYSFNVTVVPPQGPPPLPLDYLSLWPEGEPQPLVSTLNSFNGRVVANAALVPAGTPNGGVDVFVSNATNVIIDTDGYFGTGPGTGLYLYPVSPCRIADTRSDSGFTGPFGPPSLTGGSTRSFPIPSSSCGIPPNAQAYVLNMTVVPPGHLGYLTTWPTGQPQPIVSTLNSYDGTIVANVALVPAGTSGAINVFVSDNTDLVIDIAGYFAP